MDTSFVVGPQKWTAPPHIQATVHCVRSMPKAGLPLLILAWMLSPWPPPFWNFPGSHPSAGWYFFLLWASLGFLTFEQDLYIAVIYISFTTERGGWAHKEIQQAGVWIQFYHQQAVALDQCDSTPSVLYGAVEWITDNVYELIITGSNKRWS